MGNEYRHVRHEFEPVFDARSRVLILGSLPSVKSREQGFYYGHPQNRFWKVLAAIYGGEAPCTIEEKKTFLLENRIAVWDVIQECDIIGSSDSSIKNVVPTDIRCILENAPIEKICANGGTAYKLYRKYIWAAAGREAVQLPSTSPANAAYSVGKLADIWKGIIMAREGAPDIAISVCFSGNIAEYKRGLAAMAAAAQEAAAAEAEGTAAMGKEVEGTAAVGKDVVGTEVIGTEAGKTGDCDIRTEEEE